MALQQYIYRKEFGLTAAELEAEPIDQFFMNLRIYALIKEKERIMSEHSNNV